MVEGGQVMMRVCARARVHDLVYAWTCACVKRTSLCRSRDYTQRIGIRNDGIEEL